jgi:hypothetical protein
VCVVITIPDEYKSDFRTCTRPLWYEELAQYFHLGIIEAADALGMCMSAIKKICRRHSISRWPHRKLASVNKTIAMLQSKISTAVDDASRGLLRSEAVNVLTMKLRLTINPAYLVRDEAVLMHSIDSISGGGGGLMNDGDDGVIGQAPGDASVGLGGGVGGLRMGDGSGLMNGLPLRGVDGFRGALGRRMFNDDDQDDQTRHLFGGFGGGGLGIDMSVKRSTAGQYPGIMQGNPLLEAQVTNQTSKPKLQTLGKSVNFSQERVPASIWRRKARLERGSQPVFGD